MSTAVGVLSIEQPGSDQRDATDTRHDTIPASAQPEI